MDLDPRLHRKRALARASLTWEAAWPALWPGLAVLGVFAVLALTGFFALLPPWLHAVLLVAVLAALGLAARYFLHHFARPDAAAVDRRLERASGLTHRPLAALADRPSSQDPAGLALWEVHRTRMMARLSGLRAGPPRPGLPTRDPRAFRAALVLALAAGLVAAGRDAPARLAQAAWPQFAAAAPPPALRVEGWVTPPAYTGAPPVFLAAAGGAATVPAGSRLQVALSNATAPAGLAFTHSGGGGHTAELLLEEGARIAVTDQGRPVVAWNLAVQADAPPSARFTETPARAPRGLGLRLPWLAADDWGVATLRAEFRLAARPDAAPIQQEAALPTASPREARGLLQPDLSAHPWAGLEVLVRLVATDGAGQQGVSDTARLTLPERSFNHPVARAMIEQRRALSLDPSARRQVFSALQGLAAAPDAFEGDAATLLSLRTAAAQLARDRRPEAVGEVQELLWEAALALEEGRDSRTARALAEAREALREALNEREREPNTPTTEVERRAAELREAIRRHLEALAERLQRENAEALSETAPQRLMDQRDLDRRTRRLEDAARQGRNEDARRELAELEEMLKALEEGRVTRAEPAERQQQRQRGQQQMGVVQDILRRQSEMLDQGQRRQEAEDQRRARTPRGQPTPPEAAAPGERQAEARRQRALRRALGELMQQHGDLTGEVPEALGRADQAMRDAQEALGQGGDARPAQQEAMRRLQEGGRQMAQQMQRQFGRGQQGEGEGEPGGEDQAGQGGDGQDGETAQGEGRDPLGRSAQSGPGQAQDGNDTRVPEEAELLRTRRLQDELRRRGAERERARDELDYIERLLRRF